MSKAYALSVQFHEVVFLIDIVGNLKSQNLSIQYLSIAYLSFPLDSIFQTLNIQFFIQEIFVERPLYIDSILITQLSFSILNHNHLLLALLQSFTTELLNLVCISMLTCTRFILISNPSSFASISFNWNVFSAKLINYVLVTRALFNSNSLLTASAPFDTSEHLALLETCPSLLSQATSLSGGTR